jgi:hypothetical protein
MYKYYWCFSHGTLHESDWCTAITFPLRAENVETAKRLKELLFGDAEFLHELPYGEQYMMTQYAIELKVKE